MLVGHSRYSSSARQCGPLLVHRAAGTARFPAGDLAAWRCATPDCREEMDGRHQERRAKQNDAQPVRS